MKKILTLLLAFMATTCLWAYGFTLGDLTYSITSSSEPYTAEVSATNSYAGSIIIPKTVTYHGTTYSVTSIGNAVFENCSSLTSITIPNSVTSIGSSAFQGCSSLTSITIPNSVTSIGDFAFYGCSSLTAPVYNAHCFAYMPTSYSGAYTIPEGIKQIAGAAFLDCSSLTSITIPNSVTSIGDGAFFFCSSLTSVTIPNSVTSIGESAFYHCSSLTSITIPYSVTSIGEGTFGLCESLTTVICEAIEVPELGNVVFDYMPLSEATLYVPAQSLADYKAAEQWKDFGTILPIEEEKTEEEIKLQDMDMTIVFSNNEDNDSEIYRQTITIKVPTAPTIAGFTFLYWQPVAEPITNEITIQAIYEADTPTSTEVYVNPANPTQKLLRNGQVYILQDGKTYTITGQKL